MPESEQFLFSSNDIHPYGFLLQVQKNAIIINIQKFKVLKIDISSNDRITSLAWHPKSTSVFAVGSVCGEILLWNYKELKPEVIVTTVSQHIVQEIELNFYMKISKSKQGLQGLANGGIQAMKFDKVQNDKLYAASVDGKICAKDLKVNNSFVYMSTNHK